MGEVKWLQIQFATVLSINFGHQRVLLATDDRVPDHPPV